MREPHILLAEWVAQECPNIFHTHISQGRNRWKHIRLWRTSYGGWPVGYAARVDSEEHRFSYTYEAKTLEALLNELGITDQKQGTIETTLPVGRPVVVKVGSRE